MQNKDINTIKNPVIPSDWKLTSNSTVSLVENGRPPMNNLPISVLEEELPTGTPINFKTIVDIYAQPRTNRNGDIDFTLDMHYTGKMPNNSSSSSTHINHSYLPITSLIQTVATYSNRPAVQLWSFDHNTSTITPVTNRMLVPFSGWYSDRMFTVDKTNYLRVATNEWVNAFDVYRYVTHPTNVTANSHIQRFSTLVNANELPISNRALSNGSIWFSDYTAYLGKGDDIIPTNDFQNKYYHVSTDEFVKSSDTVND